jgi:hypothetical protein
LGDLVGELLREAVQGRRRLESADALPHAFRVDAGQELHAKGIEVVGRESGCDKKK